MHYFRVKNGISDMSPRRLHVSKLCKIIGCKNISNARGLCIKHYMRWKNTAVAESIKTKCTVEGCNCLVFAKSFCKVHYELNKRNGAPERKPKKFCQVEGCNRRHAANGFCDLHYYRQKLGISINRPIGINGSLNPRWNNGKSEYSNHSLMKKVRLKVLTRDQYACQIIEMSGTKKCGKTAYMVHHKDFSKDNHSEENLVAVCPHHNTVLRNPNLKRR